MLIFADFCGLVLIFADFCRFVFFGLIFVSFVLICVDLPQFGMSISNRGRLGNVRFSREFVISQFT